MTEAITKGAYYVNDAAETQKTMIAERHGLTKDHIMLSSGSSGVLTSLAMMAAQQGSIWVRICSGIQRRAWGRVIA